MQTAALVEGAGAGARFNEPNQGVRIVSVACRVDGITLVGPKSSPRKGHGQFDFDVGMTELGRTKESLRLSFSFTIENASTGQTCRISGRAEVRFANFNPEGDLNTLGRDIDNEMTVEIFRANYESVYLLHDALGMEIPSPWITQDVSLSSRAQA
jgi:hypothetical protein